MLHLDFVVPTRLLLIKGEMQGNAIIFNFSLVLIPVLIHTTKKRKTHTNSHTVEINIGPEQCWVLDLTGIIMCNLWHQILQRLAGAQQGLISEEHLIDTGANFFIFLFTVQDKLLVAYSFLGFLTLEQLKYTKAYSIQRKIKRIWKRAPCN